MREPIKKITMREVARMAGVSAMTVSKALGDKPGISEETRRHVRSVAEKLNYFPNTLATSFRTQRTQSIGIVMSAQVADVFPLFYRGVEAAANESGYSTVLANTGHGAEPETIQMLIGNMVDGLIVIAPQAFGADEASLLKNTGIPYLLAFCSHPDSDVTTVRHNNYAGGHAMVQYLVRTGGRRFLLLALDGSFSSSRERLSGWRDALGGHGLQVDADSIFHVASSIQAGREAMDVAFERGFDWDTVVCGSDAIAIGAIEALLARGVKIPDQVRVSGFDGIPLSAHLRIPLTTIQQPLFEIGEACIRMLIDMIRKPSFPSRQLVINGRLVVRRSA